MDDKKLNSIDPDDVDPFGPLGYGAMADKEGTHFVHFAREGFYIRDNPPEPFVGADGIVWVYSRTGPDGADYFSPLLNASQAMEVGRMIVEGLKEGLNG